MESGKDKKDSLPGSETPVPADRIPASIYRMMALMSTGPMSGYDISTMVSSEEFAGWKDSFGNIYPNLRRMVSMGLAAKQRDDFKGRRRYCYTLTDRGRELLDGWLLETPQRIPVKVELLFKLRFSTHLGTDVALRHMGEYRDFCRTNHPMFEKWRREVEESPSNSLEHQVTRLTSDFWYRFTRMLLEWSEDSVASLEKYRKENSPKGGGSCPEDTSSSRCYAPLL